MSFRYPFAHSFVWPATFLLLIVASQTSAQDLRPEEKAELRLLNAIATSVRDTIRGNSAINSLSDQALQSFVTKSLNTAHTQLSSEAEWGTPGSQAALNQIRAMIEARIPNLGTIVLEGEGDVGRDRIFERFLATMGTTTRTELGQRFRLSDYHFVIGGVWAHTDSAAAQGQFTASLHLRTRMLNFGRTDGAIRTPTNDDIERDGGLEAKFLDLLVDADFLTNQPFNDIIPLAGQLAGAQADTIQDLVLNSVTSSRLGFAVFLSPFGNFFADGGTAGLYGRFSIATREGSSDVFRRLSFGLRGEIRDRDSRLFRTSAEIGVTSNDAVGSFEGDISVWPMNRVVLNLKLPIHGERGFGMFVEFHGEWEHSLGFLREGNEREVFVESVGNFQNIRPPTYQFRLGALLDPAELFGPLFGS